MSVYVTTAMTAHFGDRESCGHTDHNPYCTTCLAWAEYDAIATTNRAAGLREAAEIADLAKEAARRTGQKHPEGESRDRCFARAREADAIAEAILARAAEVEKGEANG